MRVESPWIGAVTGPAFPLTVPGYMYSLPVMFPIVVSLDEVDFVVLSPLKGGVNVGEAVAKQARISWDVAGVHDQPILVRYL
jgi:hypothetical protein